MSKINKGKEFIQEISKRELVRFRMTLNGLKNTDLFVQVQVKFEQIIKMMNDQNHNEQKTTIKFFSKLSGESLRSRNANESIVQFIEKQIEKEWENLLKTGDIKQIVDIYDKLASDWETKLIKKKSPVLRKLKNYGLGTLRVVTGSGLLVFDAVKFFPIAPPAYSFLFSSFIGGVVLFYGGLDNLLE